MAGDLAVFDLDGTRGKIVDTGPDLVDTTNVVLFRAGPSDRPAGDDPATTSGLGARAMNRGRALGEPGNQPPRRTRWTAHPRGTMSSRLRGPHRAAEPAVSWENASPASDRPLEAAGRRRSCGLHQQEGEPSPASSSTGSSVSSTAFAALSGGDTYGVSKGPTRATSSTPSFDAGGASHRTVFVGDSRIDRETARAANVPIVAVTYGYSDVPVGTLSPDRLLGPGEDVAAAVLDLLASRPMVALTMR